MKHKTVNIKMLSAICAVIAAAVLAAGCNSSGGSQSISDNSGVQDTPLASQTENTPAPQSSDANVVSSQTEPETSITEKETTFTTTATTAATAETTVAATTTTTAAATTATTPVTTVTESPQTADTTPPKPQWGETEANKQLYITIDCYSRKQAVVGSESVKLMKSGEKVEVVAVTDTGYYKLSDGSFVHSDYLSETKPVVTTAETTTAPSTTPKPADTNPPQGTNSSDSFKNASAYEQEVFKLINDIRREYGLAEFKWDDAAYKVAKARVNEITQSFDHLRPNGQDPYTLYGLDNLWVAYTVVAENIARGQSTPAEVVDAWMSSTKGHRENILNPDYKNLAVAFSTNNDRYKTYWVQEFNTYR